MEIFSKLRPSDTSLTRFAATYATHRPFIQHCLTSGFAIYVLGTTYRGYSARPSKPSEDNGGKKGKRKEHKGTSDGKSPRVEVSNTLVNMSFIYL